MRNNQRGDIDTILIGCAVLFAVLLFSWVFILALFAKWEIAEDNVSGIVYSTTNNGPIAGNTSFKVRASVDSFIDKNTNESSYCLPANSPYKALVNKAASNKTVQVQVTTKKGFWVKAPWTCIDNVIVTEVK